MIGLFIYGFTALACLVVGLEIIFKRHEPRGWILIAAAFCWGVIAATHNFAYGFFAMGLSVIYFRWRFSVLFRKPQ